MDDAAWYPDPTGRHEFRWWDGAQWTEHVSDGGVTGTDPLEASAEAVTTVMATVPTARPGGFAPPAAEPAPVIPVQPVSSRIRPIVAAGGAAAALVLLLVVVLVVRGGDDATVAPDSTLSADTTLGADTTAAVTTTDAPATTATTLATVTPSTDVSSSTAVASSAPAPSSSSSSSSVAPPPPSVPAGSPWPTSGELATVLPRAADLPPTWTAAGEGPVLDPPPASGTVTGWCGGYNDAARAEDYGAAAMVVSDRYTTRPGGWFQMSVITFRDAVPASLFLSTTGEQVLECSGGFDYPVQEGSGAGQYDGFTGAFGADTVWNFYEVGAVAYPSLPPGADDVLRLEVISAYSSFVAGVEYRGVLFDVVQMERVGPHVIIWQLRGDCCIAGFTDRGPGYGYPMIDVVPDLEAIADSLRAGVLGRLVSL